MRRASLALAAGAAVALVLPHAAAGAAAAPPARSSTPPARARPHGSDDDGPVRFSLPTESDVAAWARRGFRFGLGFGYGRLVGLAGAPGGNLIGPSIRLGLRLDERWSLLASFQYLYAFGGDGISGLRYLGTLEPTWHLSRRLAVAVGLGFGGLVEGDSSRERPYLPLPRASFTYPDARYPIRSCSGVGIAGVIRGEYLMVLGPRSSTGPTVELDLQWTGCVDETSRADPYTAEPVVRRQWWPHFGASAAWVFAWR